MKQIALALSPVSAECSFSKLQDEISVVVLKWNKKNIPLALEPNPSNSIE